MKKNNNFFSLNTLKLLKNSKKPIENSKVCRKILRFSNLQKTLFQLIDNDYRKQRTKKKLIHIN